MAALKRIVLFSTFMSVSTAFQSFGIRFCEPARRSSRGRCAIRFHCHLGSLTALGTRLMGKPSSFPAPQSSMPRAHVTLRVSAHGSFPHHCRLGHPIPISVRTSTHAEFQLQTLPHLPQPRPDHNAPPMRIAPQAPMDPPPLPFDLGRSLTPRARPAIIDPTNLDPSKPRVNRILAGGRLM